MHRTIWTVCSLGFALTLFAAGEAFAGDETGWRLKLSGISAQSTAAGSLDSSLGGGLGIEYRASRRLGVELSVASVEMDDEEGLQFFGTEILVIASTVQVTPLLAQLNVHLTPDRRADFYLGPVVGRMQYGDLRVEIRSDLAGEYLLSEPVATKDGYAWGAHVGLDVPVGAHGAFFTAGAMYLQAEVETVGERDETEGDGHVDLDPLLVRAGFGYRF